MRQLWVAGLLIVLGCNDSQPVTAPIPDPPNTYVFYLGSTHAHSPTRITKSRSEVAEVLANVRGEDIKEKSVNGYRYVYLETIIEKPDPKRKETKSTRLYETAERTKAGTTTRLSFEKKKVEIAKTNGMYMFTVDGKPLPAEEDAIFRDEFANEEIAGLMDEFQPGKKVKVGEAWNVDMKATLKSAKHNTTLTYDVDKAKASAVLKDVYKKAGQQYGVIEFESEVPCLTFKQNRYLDKLKPGSVMKSKMVLDACINGSSPTASMNYTVTMDISYVLPDKDWMTVKSTIETIIKYEDPK